MPPSSRPAATIRIVIQKALGITSLIAQKTQTIFCGVGRKIGSTRLRLVMVAQMMNAPTGTTRALVMRTRLERSRVLRNGRWAALA